MLPPIPLPSVIRLALSDDRPVAVASPSKAVRVRCDIVVPIYNGLELLRHCLTSAFANTSAGYHLYLIDDASDDATGRYLKRVAADHSSRATLFRNATNQGFVKTSNAGIRLGSAPFVVLLNSDVLVTPGWLERLLECAESDPKIAAVNPLSNQAANLSVPLKPGLSFLAQDRHIERHAARAYPDVVTAVGFCLLLRRAALDQVGLFDEIYGRGYCEESDLCMRLTRAGYRTVVADNVYVYHKGGGSFSDGLSRYRHNRKLFDRRWAADYRRQYRAFRRADPLRPSRELPRLPRRWDPTPVLWQTGRELLHARRSKSLAAAGVAAARGLWRLPRAHRETVSAARIAELSPPDKLQVTYVLDKLVIAGGTLAVVQLVNELIMLGVEARIATLFQDPAVAGWQPLFTQPIVYRSAAELKREFPPSDVALATLYTTAPWVIEAAAAGRAAHSAYFIQDYEPWFLPADRPQARRRVVDDYGRIPHRIVNSAWLRELLLRDGLDSTQIPLGMDLDTFYPREPAANRPLTIIAMARPGTPRRGFRTLVEALKVVKQTLPEINVTLFGDNFLAREAIPFAFRDAGVVNDQRRLAELYAGADVFIDGSDFQGFGRCALEAMACATACALTGAGGVSEYAQDGVNCLVVPAGQPGRLAAATLRLLGDAALRQRLALAGVETARRYCRRREARETLAYLQRIAADRRKR